MVLFPMSPLTIPPLLRSWQVGHTCLHASSVSTLSESLLWMKDHVITERLKSHWVNKRNRLHDVRLDVMWWQMKRKCHTPTTTDNSHKHQTEATVMLTYWRVRHGYSCHTLVTASVGGGCQCVCLSVYLFVSLCRHVHIPLIRLLGNA